jgi:hypothetical protein
MMSGVITGLGSIPALTNVAAIDNINMFGDLCLPRDINPVDPDPTRALTDTVRSKSSANITMS